MTHSRYAPARLREVAWLLAGAVVLAVADLFFDIDWWFYAGLATGFLSWEFTKFHLRRLDRKYAPHLTPHPSHEPVQRDDG